MLMLVIKCSCYSSGLVNNITLNIVILIMYTGKSVEKIT